MADDSEAQTWQFARKQSGDEEDMASAMFDEAYKQNAGLSEQASQELFEGVRQSKDYRNGRLLRHIKCCKV